VAQAGNAFEIELNVVPVNQFVHFISSSRMGQSCLAGKFSGKFFMLHRLEDKKKT
jgi:hypothetical protein